ncbi:MAG: hypothetical protein E7575_04235 [Ruminococcaceae bacterium]|nr:hypothetical protein [Oscillospiraceae bacterium]
MTKSNITLNFYIFSLCTVTAFSALSTVLRIIGRIAANNITISSSVKNTLSFLYNTCSLLAVVSVICAIIYAHSYFGKKTAKIILFASAGIILISKAAEMLSFMIQNDMLSTLIPFVIVGSYAIEFLIYVPIILFTYGLCILFSRSRCKSNDEKHQRKRTPVIAAITAIGMFSFCFYFLIPIIDLINYIIPQLDVIVPSDMGKIAFDFLYAAKDFPSVLLGCTAAGIGYMYLARLITGRLKLKQHYELIKDKK